LSFHELETKTDKRIIAEVGNETDEFVLGWVNDCLLLDILVVLGDVVNVDAVENTTVLVHKCKFFHIVVAVPVLANTDNDLGEVDAVRNVDSLDQRFGRGSASVAEDESDLIDFLAVSVPLDSFCSQVGQLRAHALELFGVGPLDSLVNIIMVLLLSKHVGEESFGLESLGSDSPLMNRLSLGDLIQCFTCQRDVFRELDLLPDVALVDVSLFGGGELEVLLLGQDRDLCSRVDQSSREVLNLHLQLLKIFVVPHRIFCLLEYCSSLIRAQTSEKPLDTLARFKNELDSFFEGVGGNCHVLNLGFNFDRCGNLRSLMSSSSDLNSETKVVSDALDSILTPSLLDPLNRVLLFNYGGVLKCLFVACRDLLVQLLERCHNSCFDHIYLIVF